MVKSYEFGYYNSPEGKDCAQKTWSMIKLGAHIGTAAAVMDILFSTKLSKALPIIGRYAQVAGPYVLSSALFGAVTCISTQARKKDDVWNYAIGGAVSGLALGFQFKSAFAAYPLAIGFAIAGIIKKSAVDNNIVLFPMPKSIEYGPPNFYKIEITGNFIKDVPRFKD